MTDTTNLYCPVCDARAIGLAEAFPSNVTVERMLDSQRDEIARCQCGAIFNTGTTRAFGAHMTPLSLRGKNALVEDAFCTCGPAAHHVHSAVDVNYIDAQGVEQRAHGFVHLGRGGCNRWTQVG